MKKALLIFTLIGIIGTAQAQKVNIQTAANHLKHWELKEAKAAIDKAAAHVQSKAMPKTWNYRAEIYYKIAIAKKVHIRALDEDALEKAFESFKTLKELDIKKDYIKESTPGIANCAALSLNKGMSAFDSTDYEVALKYLNICIEAYELSGIKKDSIYYGPVFWIAATAEKLKKYDLAEEKYREMIDADYQKATMYKNLFSLYMNERKDAVTAEKILEEARAAFPDDLTLMQQKINIFQDRGDLEGVKVIVEEAIVKAPDNPALYYFLAKEIYSPKEDMENAIKNYDKTLEYDPDHMWASQEAGAMYYGAAMDILKAMNDIPLNQTTKYKAEEVKANAQLKSAVSYWVKTVAAAEKLLAQPDQSKVDKAVKPNLISTLRYMKKAYVRMKMKEEAAAATAKMKALGVER